MLLTGVGMRSVLAVMTAVLALGCAPQRSEPSATTQADPSVAQRAQRVLHIVVRDEPNMLNVRFDRNGQGFPLTVPLVYRDERGELHGLRSERAPSQDDGSWIVNTDGTMKTTYVLKPDLKWQDGQPHTAQDFVFTHQVYTDREIPMTTRMPESLMSELVARDDRTLEISWKEPYIFANALTENDLAPIARHLLEGIYATDKPGFTNNSFWTSEEFVSNGPYRLTKWDRGTSFTATA